MGKEEHFLWSVRLLGTKDSYHSTGEDAHEMAQGYPMALTFTAFAQVVGV